MPMFNPIPVVQHRVWLGGMRDCTAAVLDGVWPHELIRPRPEDEPAARYLHEALMRIVTRANEELAVVAELPVGARIAEEARLINVARAMAVLRVESTVRQLGRRSILSPPESAAGPRMVESQRVLPSLSGAADWTGDAVDADWDVPSEQGRGRHAQHDDFDAVIVTAGVADEQEAGVASVDRVEVQQEAEARDDGDDAATGPQKLVVPAGTGPAGGRVGASGPRHAAAAVEEAGLQAVVGSLARQQPALAWLAGYRPDGALVVMTDVASGWIPPGIVVPAGAVTLGPAQRSGPMDGWDGLESVLRYRPGDRIEGRAAIGKPSEEPFAVVEVEDLAARLTQAAGQSTTLPPLAYELAAAYAAGSEVLDAEQDVLAVHVETAVQSMLVEYPRVNEAAATSCMLLAAAQALVAGRLALAGYHYGWYEAMAAAEVNR